MTDTTSKPDVEAPGIEMDPEPEAPRRPRRLDRETLIMLVVPPVLVALVFAGFVWWRETADLDATELSQLEWSVIWTQIQEHVKLTLLSSFLVVLVAVPLGIALTRGRLVRFSPLVVGVANVGQAAPSLGLVDEELSPRLRELASP